MSNFARAFRATAPIDPAAVPAHLDQLIDNAFAGRLLIDRIAKLMSGSHRDFGRLGNLAPVVEGNMLEQAIKLLAAANPAMSVYADCKLPLYRSVLERVKSTPASQLNLATAAAGEAAKSQYAPDLILIDQLTGVALLVDIKRSLRSYESSRVAELRHRMLAAGTMLPALIKKAGGDHAIHHVRVAILNLDAPRSDIANGIWSVGQLDTLIGLPGAAALIADMRDTFARRVEAQFAAARHSMIESAVRVRVASLLDDAGVVMRPAMIMPGGSDITIGYAEFPDSPGDG